MWQDEQIRDRVKTLLPAGEHLYQLICHLDNFDRFFSFIRVLDPDTMHKNNNIANKQFEFEYLHSIFKLTDEYLLVGSYKFNI